VHLPANVDHLVDAIADIIGEDLPNIHDCLPGLWLGPLTCGNALAE